MKAWYVWRCPIETAGAGAGTRAAELKEKDSDLEDQLAEEGIPPFDGQLLRTISDPDPVNQYTTPLVIVSLGALFLVLSEVAIFLQTLLFFHTVTEKLLGTLLGSAYWMILFGLSFRYPHLF